MTIIMIDDVGQFVVVIYRGFYPANHAAFHTEHSRSTAYVRQVFLSLHPPTGMDSRLT